MTGDRKDVLVDIDCTDIDRVFELIMPSGVTIQQALLSRENVIPRAGGNDDPCYLALIADFG